MMFHLMTNNTVPCLTKKLEDKFQILNLTSMMSQYQLLLQQFQSQVLPIEHKANLTMHHELLLSKCYMCIWFNLSSYYIKTYIYGHKCYHTKSINEFCLRFSIYLCRILSLAISRCQSIVWKSSYWPIPGISSVSPDPINIYEQIKQI